MILDIFGMAGNAIAPVNPRLTAVISYSSGQFTINDDGSQVPQYSAAFVEIEVQAATSEDLKQLETISQQADYRAVYVYGALNAINRPLQMGGDILNFYGANWLVTQQLEAWGEGDWTKVLVTRQIS